MNGLGYESKQWEIYHVPEQRPDLDLVKGLVIPTIITKIGIKLNKQTYDSRDAILSGGGSS